MASYVVMAPADGETTDEVTFVRDGFAFLAFLIPAAWLLWHRLWIEALVAIAVAVGLAMLRAAPGFLVAAPLLSLLVSIFFGFEGAALRLAALRRRGWRDVGVVEADDMEAAEIRWLAENAGAWPDAASGRSDLPPEPGPRHKPDPRPMLGFLLNPGKS